MKLETTLTQEQAFLSEIGRQLHFAFRSIEPMNAGIGSGEELDHEVFWPAFQDFVLATAQISKMLWPSGTGGSSAEKRAREARGRRLRDLLMVEDSSAIASRACRNHLEHFDERIDSWLGTGKSHMWADFNCFSGIADDSPVFTHQIRAMNMSTGSVVVFGELFQIQPLVDALEELVDRLGPAAARSRQEHEV